MLSIVPRQFARIVKDNGFEMSLRLLEYYIVNKSRYSSIALLRDYGGIVALARNNQAASLQRWKVTEETRMAQHDIHQQSVDWRQFIATN